MSILYLLESLKRKELFKPGQKQPDQGAKCFIICGTKLFGENILKKSIKLSLYKHLTNLNNRSQIQDLRQRP